MASPYSKTCTGANFLGWAFSAGGRSWEKKWGKREERKVTRGIGGNKTQILGKQRVLWAWLGFYSERQGLQYLDVGAWEDSHSAMVFAFVPVLINLLINVNNVSLLQRKLPVDRGSLHFSKCFSMYKIKTLEFVIRRRLQVESKGTD